MRDFSAKHVYVIDAHAGGAPTRVVLEGGPDLGDGSMAERLALFRDQHDEFRSAVIDEPRGCRGTVGALLCQPVDEGCAAGVIFFDHSGYLDLCAHALMSVLITLGRLGRVAFDTHRIETPAGEVKATLENAESVIVEGVPSYRHRQGVRLEVEGYGAVMGDVAWSGNWFFLSADHRERVVPENTERLTALARRIGEALEREGIAGTGGRRIDHIELSAPSETRRADSRNFVLGPGGYDRSPCGTGTAAKLACLAAEGKLATGQVWRQEGIVGSVFEAWYEPADGDLIIPSVRGSAYITAEATLILDANDPFRFGTGR